MCASSPLSRSPSWPSSSCVRGSGGSCSTRFAPGWASLGSSAPSWPAYLLAIMFPFGLGTVARSWLVARREDLRFASVLVTVAIDRLTDGLICACLVPIALVLVAFPDPSGGVRAGLVWGGALSFALVLALAFVLVLYRRDVLLPRDASCASRTV